MEHEANRPNMIAPAGWVKKTGVREAPSWDAYAASDLGMRAVAPDLEIRTPAELPSLLLRS
ncbi:hypothetical protein [Bradyrhizobium sp.]|uniref:hypothetical protein n=1 Tax=Bradyrhizobium sp. TaxID=376 RepID=UPI00403782CF